MPELPEVETIRNVLLNVFVGKTITKIDILRHCTIKTNEKEFVCGLTNKKVLNITRKGKFLIFHFTNDKVLISHLRMEGKYYEMEENQENSKYARVVFHLNNGKKVCYDDSRCFGIMLYSNEKEYLLTNEISKLGPEPFQIDDCQYFINRCKHNKTPIKSTLLDQTLMTGLGNIYADEVLFASKIHPLTPANLITLDQWKILVENSKKILTKAIKAGGSTIKSYHPGKGVDGMFQTELLAYGHKDEKCPNCGNIMRFIKVGGRGTTYCPHCQVKTNNTISIAIFGKIASGKSTVVDMFAKNGIKAISCDDIVHDLYKDSKIGEKVSKIANISFDGLLNLKTLRNVVSSNEKVKKQIEKFINPLIAIKVDNFLKTNRGLLLVEVPRLFEAKFNDKFDVIIAVDIDEKHQLERLKKRNPESYMDLTKINANNTFEQDKKKADFIVDNSRSLENTNKQVNKIINILKDRLS